MHFHSIIPLLLLLLLWRSRCYVFMCKRFSRRKGEDYEFWLSLQWLFANISLKLMLFLEQYCLAMVSFGHNKATKTQGAAWFLIAKHPSIHTTLFLFYISSSSSWNTKSIGPVGNFALWGKNRNNNNNKKRTKIEWMNEKTVVSIMFFCLFICSVRLFVSNQSNRGR